MTTKKERNTEKKTEVVDVPDDFWTDAAGWTVGVLAAQATTTFFFSEMEATRRFRPRAVLEHDPSPQPSGHG